MWTLDWPMLDIPWWMFLWWGVMCFCAGFLCHREIVELKKKQEEKDV